MKCIAKLCLFIILFALVQASLPQNKLIGQIPYRHYTPKDGLAGSNIMAFIQDKKGFIWFATSTGLSRFDGHEFINYSTADGLLTDNLTGITSNGGDSLFISTYDKGINVIYNDKIFEYKIDNEKAPLIHHMIGNSNRLFIYGDYFSEIYNNKFKKIRNNKTIGNNYLGNNYHVYDALITKDSVTYICSTLGLFYIKNNKSKKITQDGKSNVITSIYEISNNEYLTGGFGFIKKYNSKNFSQYLNNIILPKNNSVQNLLIDNFNNIWFSITSRGLYFIKNGAVFPIGDEIGLENEQINFIKKDTEGNIWVGTFGDGLYCIYNLAVTNYSSKTGLSNDFILDIFKGPEKILFVGTYNGLNVYDDKRFIHLKSNIPGEYHYVHNIQRGENGIMYVNCLFQEQLGTHNKIFTVKYKNVVCRYYAAAAAYCVNDSVIILGSWNSEITYNSFNENTQFTFARLELSFGKNQRNKITTILKDNYKSLWIGSTGGLCRIGDNDTTYFKNDNILNQTINDIKQDRNNRIWVASSNGVASYEKGNWTDYSGLLNKNISINTITFDNENNVWFGGNKGVMVLKDSVIYDYTERLGLLNNEINSLFYDKNGNIIWIGTNQGLSRLELLTFKKYKQGKLPTYITLVEADDSLYNINQPIIFPASVKNIRLKFTSINFREPKNIIYEYKLDKSDNNWNATTNTEIQFASLSQGSYHLFVRSKLSSGEWNAPITFPFVIQTPFYNTYYFFSFILILFIILIYIGTKRLAVIKQKKEILKKEAEHQVILLKQQALAAMMNPHFVFNSLNSIQTFMNTHNMYEANSYLSNFAKLIRLNLNISEFSEIILEEELRRLNLYLSLEKLRFGDDFNYFINTSPNINTEKIKIPNMIIQPFVENSIWHGILPNGNKGNLDITIDINNKNELLIIIEDDGVGYDKSLKEIKSEHISKGIKIIENRLKLISSEKYKKDHLIHIEKIENDSKTGTRVTIMLPQELYCMIN